MKKIIRLTSLCLAILMISTVIPFRAVAAVSVPSNVKSVVFDATYYASKYADLKAAFGTDATKLYNHFINNGVKEGRQASPMFSVDYYLKNNADLKAAFGSNRESAFNHFVSYGINEQRVTAPAADVGTGIDVRISMNSGGMNLGYTGANVYTVTPVFKADQSWRLDRQKDGSYKITNNATGKVLDVYAASRASGANVDLYASNDTNAQRWFIYKNTNGTYTMRAKCGTTCALSVNGNSTAAGANVQMNTYNGAAGQQFKITKLSALESMEPANIGSNFWGNIRGVGSNYNLGLSNDNVLIRYPNSGYRQTWRFIRFSDGSYEITNLYTGKSLDCAAGSGAAGTNVATYMSNNTNAQRWYIFKVDGNYVFVPKCTMECALTVKGGGTASGTNVELAKYSASSTAQQFKVIKLTKSESKKDLAISEICQTPTNGAYEFMEIINTSDKAVNLNKYSLYRFGFANSGKNESNGYNILLGLVSGVEVSTDIKCLERVNLSSYNASIAPNGIAVLWFVTYANRNLTVDDFKAYWTAQGSDMTNVAVIPVAIHDGSADIHAATKINKGCGAGFLPDKKAGVALSLVKNEAVNVRLDNGTDLGSVTASADALLARELTAEIHNRADSIALYFVRETAETGTSRNYYNYVDYDAYAYASSQAIKEPMRTYIHTFAAVPYSAQVTTSNTTAGYPKALGEYINLDSTGTAPGVITYGVDGGNKKTDVSPGTRWCGQFAGLDLIGTSVDASGNLTLTGKFEYDQYKELGFVVTTVATSTGKAIAKKTVSTADFKAINGGYSYSVTVSGLPINDSGIVLSVVPYAIYSESDSRVNGTAEEIRCPLVSATINGKDITGLKVTYLANEENAPANDVTGIKEAVELLANDIEYYTGVEVETGVYDPRAAYPQIVIATSGNGAGGNALVANNKTVGANQYSIVNKTTGEIYVIGGNAIAAEYASQLIVKALANATGNVELKDLCFDVPKTLNTKNNHLPLTDGANYRIMTFNMLWYEGHKDTSRYNKMVEFINYYSPDVIGFQECCLENMNRFMPLLKAQGYTVIQAEVFTGTESNRVPLAYKTSKFTCLEKGWKELPGNDERFGVTWAVLKDKTTSQVFAATSTHFYNVGGWDHKLPIRVKNSQMILDVTKDIVKRHGCEVVNMGDYNMRTYDEAYHLMVDDGILTETRFTAFRNNGIMIRGGHTLNTTAPLVGSPSRVIDFFFTTSKVNVLRSRTIINMTSAVTSDHAPVYTDISFIK